MSECRCHESGSVNSSCNEVTGQCQCEAGFSGLDCSVCPDGFHRDEFGMGCIGMYMTILTVLILFLSIIHSTYYSLSRLLSVCC